MNIKSQADAVAKFVEKYPQLKELDEKLKILAIIDKKLKEETQADTKVTTTKKSDPDFDIFLAMIFDKHKGKLAYNLQELPLDEIKNWLDITGEQIKEEALKQVEMAKNHFITVAPRVSTDKNNEAILLEYMNARENAVASQVTKTKSWKAHTEPVAGQTSTGGVFSEKAQRDSRGTYPRSSNDQINAAIKPPNMPRGNKNER